MEPSTGRTKEFEPTWSQLDQEMTETEVYYFDWWEQWRGEAAVHEESFPFQFSEQFGAGSICECGVFWSRSPFSVPPPWSGHGSTSDSVQDKKYGLTLDTIQEISVWSKSGLNVDLIGSK